MTDEFKRVPRAELIRLVVYYRSLVEAFQNLVGFALREQSFKPFKEFVVSRTEWNLAESLLHELEPEIVEVKKYYETEH